MALNADSDCREDARGLGGWKLLLFLLLSRGLPNVGGRVAVVLPLARRFRGRGRGQSRTLVRMVFPACCEDHSVGGYGFTVSEVEDKDFH